MKIYLHTLEHPVPALCPLTWDSGEDVLESQLNLEESKLDIEGHYACSYNLL